MNQTAKMGFVAVAFILVLGIIFIIVAVANMDDSPKETAKKQTTKAQPTVPQTEEDKAIRAATVVSGIAVGVLVCAFLILAYWVFVIGCMVWVGRDAYDRGHEGGLWVIVYILPHLFVGLPYGTGFMVALMILLPLPFFLVGSPIALTISWLGFIVYLLVRRRGTLTACMQCGNKRLEYAKLCTHCGHA
jgi:hypothetical protein